MSLVVLGWSYLVPYLRRVSMVRAKFRVDSYETRLAGAVGTEELRSVRLSAVVTGSEENKSFFRWTPNGKIEMGILNPEAWKQLPLGAEVYVDFTIVEPKETA